jgi:hypothetical protein
VIDEFALSSPKTKDFVSTLAELGAAAKTLVVDSLDNANLVLSARNVQKTKVTNSYGLNIYDLIYHEKLFISKSAIEELNRILDPNSEPAEAVSVAEEKPKAKRAAKPKAEAANGGEEKPKATRKKKAEAAADENAEVTGNE